MAEQKSSSTYTTEKTFRSYTKDEGAAYAEHRYGYHPNLYQRILDYHVSGGGKLDTVLDVGCGPGTATKSLATFFTNAIGIDPSEGMITTARSQSGTSSSGQPIRYEVLTAEDIGGKENNIIPVGSVDLITAATAAHWFDMTQFWPGAAKLLRPGGTVAIWTGSFAQCHRSTPNADRLNAALDEIEERELGPFMEPGNIHVRELYAKLALPWDSAVGGNAAAEFDRVSFVRKEWGTPGNDDAEAEGQEFFLNGQVMVNMDVIEKGIATASPVARWRKANPDKVGTEMDVVRLYRRAIERFLHEAGVPVGEERIRGNVAGVLLMVKKKA